MLDEDRDINPYLQQEVLSASPIRLRFMLICRAKDLCEGVESLWRDGQNALGDQWSLRIREILGELLSGVAEGNPVSSRVADFYLFLLKVLSEAENSRDTERIKTLRDLLAFEAETWQMFLQKSAIEEGSQLAPPVSKLSTLPRPTTSSYGEDFSTDSSFSLDV